MNAVARPPDFAAIADALDAQASALTVVASALRAGAVASPRLHELRPVAALADEWGLERKGLEAVIRAAKIATVKIGRKTCVRPADVVGAVEKMPAPKKAKPSAGAATVDAANAYAELVATGTGGRRGRR
ncbi:MAG: hypothetical protein KF795_17860 [Labilithrix sp.]|nr:hypothetical protein [Labilithrix sp.]